MRVKVKFTVKFAVCNGFRLLHTAILTVNLALTRMSETALMCPWAQGRVADLEQSVREMRVVRSAHVDPSTSMLVAPARPSDRERELEVRCGSHNTALKPHVWPQFGRNCHSIQAV